MHFNTVTTVCWTMAMRLLTMVKWFGIREIITSLVVVELL